MFSKLLNESKTITQEGKYIKIVFPYDPIIVSIVGKLNGRKFRPKTKDWIVPKVNLENVVNSLSPFSFLIDKELNDEYEYLQKRKIKIRKILSGEFNPKEKEILDNLPFPLFPFQKIGVGFMCTAKSCLLGDEPGLGKTLQSLATTYINKAKKTLVVCPATLKYSWKEEITKWLPDKKHLVVIGSKKEREELWEKEDAEYVIMNYELLLKDSEMIRKKEWDYIIADEATRISNPRAKQTKELKKIESKNKIAMTGTPLNNAIEDIWSIMDFCKPGMLGDYYQFTEKYCIKDRFFTRANQKVTKISGYKNLDELKEIIASSMVRRKKDEVLTELPDKLYENIYIDFEPEERKIYDAVVDEIIEELKRYKIEKIVDEGDEELAISVLTKILRLSQVCDSTELVSKNKFSSKLKALKELLTDILIDDSKAIIFTHFAEMANILVDELKEYNPLLISGDVKIKERQENVNKLTNDDKHKIIIMTEAGGMGLNLQRANYVIHYDLPWSISKLQQREDRAHRIGQQRHVTVFKLLINNSIDCHVLEVLKRKEELAIEILGDKVKVRKFKIRRKLLNKILTKLSDV